MMNARPDRREASGFRMQIRRAIPSAPGCSLATGLASRGDRIGVCPNDRQPAAMTHGSRTRKKRCLAAAGSS